MQNESKREISFDTEFKTALCGRLDTQWPVGLVA